MEKKLPYSVCAILIIDCWSVHHSAEFLSWMRANYSKLICIHFVPANCRFLTPYIWLFHIDQSQFLGTQLFQPDDVGINWYWKWKMAGRSVEWMAHQVQDALKARKKECFIPNRHANFMGCITQLDCGSTWACCITTRACSKCKCICSYSTWLIQSLGMEEL